MSKVLIFSDIHIHQHKRQIERLEDCLQVLSWVFETAKERSIKDIIFAGDLFHERNSICVYTYQRTYEVLFSYLVGEQFRLYLLLGNHDLWYHEKSNISSVTPFGSLPGVTVISKPTRLRIAGHRWDFIPYTHNPVESINSLQAVGKSESAYAVAHVALSGARLHGNTFAEVNIEHDNDMVVVDKNIFKAYKRTFLGHYHIPQILNDTVEYVGSSLELTYGDLGQDKHIIEFDPAADTKTYISNDFSPKHLILAESDLEKHCNLNNCFVRIEAENIGSADIMQKRAELIKDNSGLRSVEIKHKKKKIDEHLISDAKAVLHNESDMLAKYLEEVGTNGLDREKLLVMGAKICSAEQS